MVAAAVKRDAVGEDRQLDLPVERKHLTTISSAPHQHLSSLTPRLCRTLEQDLEAFEPSRTATLLADLYGVEAGAISVSTSPGSVVAIVTVVATNEAIPSNGTSQVLN